MLGQPFALEVTVAVAGYRLVKPAEIAQQDSIPEMFRANAHNQNWIVEKGSEPGRGGVRWQDPDATDPILYRRFAGLCSQTAEDILAFANEWGFLAWGRPMNPSNKTERANESQEPSVYAESLEFWRNEIGLLAYAVSVYEAIRDGNRDWLGSRLKFVDAPQRAGGSPPSGAWHLRTHWQSEESGPGFLSRYSFPKHKVELEYEVPLAWAEFDQTTSRRSDDPRTVASVWLDQTITNGLMVANEFGFGFNSDDRAGARGLRIFPMDLLSLMWWQFARAIANSTQERACRECGKWFILNPKDRDRKFFCSESCKTKNFRGRKKQAAELHASGEHTLEAIAEATLSDVETVRNWLGIKETGRRTVTKRK